MSSPIIVDFSGRHERVFDMYSRLLRDRIIMLDETIEDQCASMIVAQLLFLEAQAPGVPISLYINSPGGVVSAGLAIYDTMQYVRSPIMTLCMGQAASMAAVLLSSGTPGMRVALPNSRIMVHQPTGAFRGQTSDAEIHTREMVRLRTVINGILAKNTGLPVEQIAEMTERDTFLTAQEALRLRLVDGILGGK